MNGVIKNELNESTKSILVVEGEIIRSRYGVDLTGRYGFEVNTATSGEEAVEFIKNNPGVDLVLIDFKLSKGMNCIETAIAILKDNAVPVIFIVDYLENNAFEESGEFTPFGCIIAESSDQDIYETIERGLMAHAQLFRNTVMHLLH